MPRLCCLATFILASEVLPAQQLSTETASKILDRLDELEKQNRQLLSEVRTLREEVEKMNQGATQSEAPVEERLDAAEQRIKEQAQTKVQASQRFPISLTGMFLFDSFFANGTDSPQFQQRYGDYALEGPGGGATLNQSIIGLDFRGPTIFGDGRISGTLLMDFFGGESPTYSFRIRRGFLSFDWKNRSIILGQDKSIIAPLAPTSFARVGVPPLSGAGNLWLWRPQVTYEERIPISQTIKASVQASLFETDETYTSTSTLVNTAYPQDRPAVQAHAQVQYHWTESSRISVGIAGSGSTSHVLGQSIPSRVYSADLSVKPVNWLELSGTVLQGRNFANLGGIPPGVTVSNNGQTIVPIRGSAGWLQAAFPVTERLTFDIYAGKQVNKPQDLSAFEVLHSETVAGNVLYRLAPNVVIGFEAARSRVEYLNALTFWTNRYDATAAYLF